MGVRGVLKGCAMEGVDVAGLGLVSPGVRWGGVEFIVFWETACAAREVGVVVRVRRGLEMVRVEVR